MISRCSVVRLVRQRVFDNSRRRLSSIDSASEAEAIAAKLAISQEIKPRPIFPWRHDVTPLPRLIEGSPDFYKDIVLPPRGQRGCAKWLLGKSFASVYLGIGGDWRDELAQPMEYAFTQAVAGIASNVYNLPYNEVCKSDKIEFNYSSEDKDESATTETSINSSNDEFVPNIDSMLDRPLRQLYENAHKSGRNQLQIKLTIEPKSACLKSVFGLLFISRRDVTEDTEGLAKIKRLSELPHDPPFSDMVQAVSDFILAAMERRDFRSLDTTVEAQVIVTCDESFQVIDRATGVVLQGSEDGAVRQVDHLVRFETTVTTHKPETFPFIPKNTIGSWIITDIDDLLGFKKWYHI
jgi:hypothetical protein